MTQTRPEPGAEVIPLERKTWWRALSREIRHRKLTYATVLGFVAIGPVLTWMIFPEASWSLGLFGGAILGGFFAFCAIPDKLFE
jgi:hypothetical protein